MKFRMSEPGEIDRAYFPTTAAQWVSEGGRWLVQLNRVMYGFRCNAGMTRERAVGYDLDYCCGTHQLALLLVPAMVMKVLEPLDEAAATCDQVCRLFPRQHVKPMHNDPECWEALWRAAGFDEVITPLLPEDEG